MTSKIISLGYLRWESEHLKSGTKIFTDSPTEKHGKGEVFPPTDLCATSLAQCMLTTIAILGKDKGINIEGSYCELQKIMNPKPRRIAEIVCDLYFSGKFSEDEKAFIEDTALNCPVALTLSSEVKKCVTFNYQD